MYEKKKHIILIGMPACGKSTVGVLAAKELGYRFIDSDLVIQEREGKKLHELISEKGRRDFLEIEESVNLTLGKDEVPSIIATGGSAVYGEKAMLRFKEIGYVVYLKISYEDVKKRLGNFTHRGVVMPRNYTLKDLYDERCALCEKYAEIVIEEEAHESFSAVVSALCKAVEERS